MGCVDFGEVHVLGGPFHGVQGVVGVTPVLGAAELELVRRHPNRGPWTCPARPTQVTPSPREVPGPRDGRPRSEGSDRRAGDSPITPTHLRAA